MNENDEGEAQERLFRKSNKGNGHGSEEEKEVMAMKRGIALLLTMIMVVLLLPVFASAALETNLTLGYTFDDADILNVDDAKDVVGTNDGVNNASGGADTGAPGVQNEAYRFVGANSDYVQATTAGSLGPNGPFTLCLTLKRNSTGATHIIASSRETTPLADMLWGFLSDNTMIWRIYDTESDELSFTSTGTFTDTSNWHTYCFVYDGGTTASAVTMYEDGVSVASTDGSFGTFGTRRNSAKFKVGGQTSGGSFDGPIDEVFIWQRNLSVTEVNDYYNNGSLMFYNQSSGLFQQNGTTPPANNVPVLSAPSFTPSPPEFDNELNATVTYTDGDLDTGDVTFTWRVNGSIVYTENVLSVASSTQALSTLGVSNFTATDQVNVTVNASDGTDASNIVSVEETVTSAVPPVLSVLTFNPSPPQSDVDVGASVTYTDADLQNGNVTFTWRVNGTIVYAETVVSVVSATQAESTLGVGNFTDGNQVNVTVNATDAGDDSFDVSNTLSIEETVILPIPLELNLTLIYTFDDNDIAYFDDALDAVGSNLGVNDGDADIGFAGVQNEAYQFVNANSDWVQATNAGTLGYNTDTNGAFTTCLTLKRTSTGGTHVIASQRETGGGETMLWNFASDDTMYWRVFDTDGDSLYEQSTGTFTDTSNWHTYCLVYDGGTTASAMTMYEDGVAVGSSDISIGTFNTRRNLEKFKVGGQTSGGSFDGFMDEVVVWERALAFAEVNDYYNNGSLMFYNQSSGLFQQNGTTPYTDKAPTLSDLIFTPSPPEFDNEINATVTYDDLNTDPGNVTFTWRVNGSVVYTENVLSVAFGSQVLSTLVGAGNFTDGDQVNVTVNATANETASNIVSIEETVTSPVPPVLSVLNFNPSPPVSGVDAGASVTYTDADLQNGSVTFTWRVNGSIVYTENVLSVVSATQAESTLSMSNFVEGNQVNVTVNASDIFNVSNTLSIEETVSAPIPLALNLTLVYTFDDADIVNADDAGDAVGSNLGVNGGDADTGAPGMLNEAYRFVKANADWVRATNGGELGYNADTNGAFTLCVAFKRNATGVGQVIASQRESTPTASMLWGFGADDTMNWRIWDTDSDQLFEQSTGTFTDTTNWHDYCLVYDGGTTASAITMYEDGVSVPSTDISTGTFNTRRNTDRLKIGGQTASGDFDGPMDEVVVWERAISSAEVLDYYNNGDLLFYNQTTGAFQNLTASVPMYEYNFTVNDVTAGAVNTFCLEFDSNTTKFCTASGLVTMSLVNGTYEVMMNATGYYDDTDNVSVSADGSHQFDTKPPYDASSLLMSADPVWNETSTTVNLSWTDNTGGGSTTSVAAKLGVTVLAIGSDVTEFELTVNDFAVGQNTITLEVNETFGTEMSSDSEQTTLNVSKLSQASNVLPSGTTITSQDWDATWSAAVNGLVTPTYTVRTDVNGTNTTLTTGTSDLFYNVTGWTIETTTGIVWVEATDGFFTSYARNAADFIVDYDASVSGLTCPANTFPNEDDMPGVAQMEVNFTVTAPLGFANENVNDVRMTLGGDEYASTTCTITTDSSTQHSYNCTVPMRYFYLPGDYDMGVNVTTTTGKEAIGSSASACTYVELLASKRTVDTITFPGAAPGTTNVAGTPPMNVRNTGNKEFNLSMTAFDLIGRSTPGETLDADTLKAGEVLGTASTMAHNVTTDLNMSVAPSDGAEDDVNIWLSMPITNSPQEYYTDTPWQLVVNG